MLHATPDEWSFEDWTLVVTALREAKHAECLCYECDTIDSLLEDIAWYWDLDEHELCGIWITLSLVQRILLVISLLHKGG